MPGIPGPGSGDGGVFGKKKSGQFVKALIAFLLGLINGDMEKGSEDLLAVCKGDTRTQKYVPGTRPFCTLAHGLYCLAQILLSKDVFRELEMLNRIFEASPGKGDPLAASAGFPFQYNKTITACFVGYIVQAVINNFTPLLFFREAATFRLFRSRCL